MPAKILANPQHRFCTAMASPAITPPPRAGLRDGLQPRAEPVCGSPTAQGRIWPRWQYQQHGRIERVASRGLRLVHRSAAAAFHSSADLDTAFCADADYNQWHEKPCDPRARVRFGGVF
jgi:hypothetical protein